MGFHAVLVSLYLHLYSSPIITTFLRKLPEKFWHGAPSSDKSEDLWTPFTLHPLILTYIDVKCKSWRQLHARACARGRTRRDGNCCNATSNETKITANLRHLVAIRGRNLRRRQVYLITKICLRHYLTALGGNSRSKLETRADVPQDIIICGT